MTGLTAKMAMLTEHEAYTPPRDSGLSADAVPFGIYHLDQAFPRGIKPYSPQIIAIQGEGGSRKTSLVLNLIINQCLSGLLHSDYRIGIDTLESGMTIERYFMVMKCIIATKIMIYEYHTGPQGDGTLWELFNRPLPHSDPQMILSEIISERNNRPIIDCYLFPDFIESCYAGQPGYDFSKRQLNAWERAGEAILSFPIVTYGVSEHYDDEERKLRYTNTTNIEAAYARWIDLHQGHGVRQIVVDYIQEYFIPNTFHDYDKLKAIIPYFGEWVKQASGTLWAISQESVTNVREAKEGDVSGAAGGNTLRNVSHANFRMMYKKDKTPFWTIIFSPVKGRRGNFPSIGVMTDPFSGALFGKSVEYQKIKGLYK